MRRLWPTCRRRDSLERAIREAAKKTDRAIDRLALTAAIEGEEVVDAIDRLTVQVSLIAKALGPDNQATNNTLIIAVGGNQMATTITVDTTDATVTLAFQDDKGDPTPAPATAAVVFNSDTETICTVAPDSVNPFQGNLTPVAAGSFTLSATTSGSYVNSNPILAPAPVALTIQAGAAVGDLLVVAAGTPANPSVVFPGDPRSVTAEPKRAESSSADLPDESPFGERR
jgi:hypothetical protein